MTATRYEVTVRAVDVHTEGVWAFRTGVPNWQGSDFDPFPAYAHNLKETRRAVAHVVNCWPPTYDIELATANLEEVGRSNGYSHARESGHYENDEYVKDPIAGLIVFSAKRIPPHPAVTRYLVAHEYGHHVEWMLNKARGVGIRDDGLIREYADLRGLEAAHLHHGAGGTWHDSASEVFACDFRILVCHVEPEFWPHPTVPRPEDVPTLTAWWRDVQSTARNAA